MRGLSALGIVTLVACGKPQPTVAPSDGAIAPREPEAFVVPKPPDTALTSQSGLRWVVDEPGSGGAPMPTDLVVVRYEVWHASGKLVARTEADEPPGRLEMAWLPRGWAEGMAHLSPGGRARMWLPAVLGYGEEAGAGPHGDLYITVELLEVERRYDPGTAALPIAAPPREANYTASGIAWIVMRSGSGKAHPGPRDRVTVHYTGWTTDGAMFDTTDQRGPATFPLHAVIPGWTEGLQLMVEGDKIRLWIPPNLAYGDRKGVPSGMLVFDVELLSFEREAVEPEAGLGSLH
jgi:peptidylprolyl isomerase